MIPQLEEYLFHLESSRQRLDQHSSSDCVVRHADVRLGEQEDVIPETRFKVMLHFREIKVRARASFDEFLGVMVKVKSKIKERAGHGSSIDGYARFIEMPASRAE